NERGCMLATRPALLASGVVGMACALVTALALGQGPQPTSPCGPQGQNCSNLLQNRIPPEQHPCNATLPIPCDPADCLYCYDECQVTVSGWSPVIGPLTTYVCTHPSPPLNCGEVRGITYKWLCQ